MKYRVTILRRAWQDLPRHSVDPFNDLAEANAKIEATQWALQTTLDAQGGEELRQLVERKDIR